MKVGPIEEAAHEAVERAEKRIVQEAWSLTRRDHRFSALRRFVKIEAHLYRNLLDACDKLQGAANNLRAVRRIKEIVAEVKR